MVTIKLKRIYEESSESDGIRILIDRLWPRGISKERANLDYWLKELAPSHELRKWFNHEENKFEAFKGRYKDELKGGEAKEAYNKLLEIISNADCRITLLYATKDKDKNHAQVIKQIIQ